MSTKGARTQIAAATIQTNATISSDLELANGPSPVVPNFLKSKASSGPGITLTGSGKIPALDRVKSQASLEVLQQNGEMTSARLSRNSQSKSSNQ